MPVKEKIIGRHVGGGLALTSGVTNLDLSQNIESRNMRILPDGAIYTALGADDTGWNWNESGKGIDGLGKANNYPNLLFSALNGKIKYVDASITPQTSGVPYEADTTLSLTSGQATMFKEFRGSIYYANGADNSGRIAIAQLKNAVTGASTTWNLNYAEGYKFTNGVAKVYCQGVSTDYTAVSSAGAGDDLTTVTNSHTYPVGSYVTQKAALTPPPSGSLKAACIAFWRSTMWAAGMPDEPNVLRYSKTISSVGTVSNVNDFSDGNNFLVGEYGKITALQDTYDRLYIFTNNAAYYIGIVTKSDGTETFSTVRLFNQNYGCANPFCVTQMEDKIVYFTGSRVIALGYAQNSNQIQPDETFDTEIVPNFVNNDADQSGARLTYDPTTKELRLIYMVGGKRMSMIRSNKTQTWTGVHDLDVSHIIYQGTSTYFGDPDNCITYKNGNSFNFGGVGQVHRYKSGRYSNGSQERKLWLRGKIRGKKTKGSTLNFVTYIDGDAYSGTRYITDKNARTSDAGESLGDGVISDGAIGYGGPPVKVFPFTYPFLIGKHGVDIQHSVSSSDEDAFWSVEAFEYEYVAFEQDASKHY